jgi:hypothetical protein
MGDNLKNWNNQKLIFRPLMHDLRNQIFTLRRRVLYFAIQDRVINTINYKKHICRLQSINVGFAEQKGKQLNTSFLLAPFWLKANIRNVMIYSLKLYT